MFDRILATAVALEVGHQLAGLLEQQISLRPAAALQGQIAEEHIGFRIVGHLGDRQFQLNVHGGGLIGLSKPLGQDKPRRRKRRMLFDGRV